MNVPTNLFMWIMACLPIIVLLLLMIKFQWGATEAAPVGLAITIITGIVFYKADIRWQAIAESAAKQSKRSLVPRVSGIMTLKEAFDYVESQGFSVRLIPYEHEAGMDGTKTELDAAGPGQDIAVFIGPEGGFDEREIELALSKGVRPISLGRRILRTETAGLALLSVLMMRLEGAL